MHIQALNRDDDISARGDLCKVHDYDGKIVYLKDAIIWYNNDGNYVNPRHYKPSFFEDLFDLITKQCCLGICI